jgi:hypothetical protein
VPLSTLVNMRQINGPEFTMRFNEYRAAQINGVLAPGFSTRQGMRALEEVFAQTMPRDMGFDYSGMSFQERAAEQGIPPAAVFGFSLILVFLILAAQYESWTLPFGVLLGTPIAVLGAVAALWLGRFGLDVFSQIGLIMLIGLAAKNAILIASRGEEQERGASPWTPRSPGPHPAALDPDDCVRSSRAGPARPVHGRGANSQHPRHYGDRGSWRRCCSPSSSSRSPSTSERFRRDRPPSKPRRCLCLVSQRGGGAQAAGGNSDELLAKQRTSPAWPRPRYHRGRPDTSGRRPPSPDVPGPGDARAASAG